MPAPSHVTIAARAVSLDRGARTVLAAVDLRASSGQVVGLVGPNGAGKSTLLDVLAGRLVPDDGTVELTPPSAVVTLLDQEPARDGETGRARVARRTGATAADAALTAATEALASGEPGADDLYADALDRWTAVGAADLDARLGTVADDLGLPAAVLDRPTATLSGGQASRLGLATALLTRADVLLLDEPTNDLDFEGLARLESHIAGHGGVVVLVSHDRRFLERTVTDVIELDGHSHATATFAGGWAAYLEETATARRHAEEAYATYTARRDELRGSSQRIREWSSQGIARARRSGETDKFIRHRQSQTSEAMAAKAARADRAVDRLEVVDKPFEGWELRLDLAAAERSGSVVARLTGAVVDRGNGSRVSGGDGGPGGFTLGPVDIEVRSGDRIVVAGPNGAGKSTLVVALLGRVDLAAGERWFGPSVRVGELEQVRDRWSHGTVLEAMLAATGSTLAETRSLLAKLGLGADHVDRPGATLSPGERTRASLALLMAVGTNWLVLDEPTNHLDLPAIEQLEQALDGWSGTLLVVSHDRAFLDAVTTDATRHLDVVDGVVTER